MITLWSYLIFGNSAIIAGVMRSSGTVLVPTLYMLVGIWIIEIPTAYFGMQRFGLPGVWIGYPAYYLWMLCSNFVYYEFYWKTRTHEKLI
jgi:Na+-driven multidrug efflux pump